MGAYAQNQRDFTSAVRRFEALAEHGKQRGNAQFEAVAYHQLGMIAQEQRDFAAAEQWYRKALAIEEKQGDAHGAARTYSGLGILAGLQNHVLESGRWLVRAIVGFTHQHDPHEAERDVNNFMIIYRQAPPADQAALRQIWGEAELGTFPESRDQAVPAKRSLKEKMLGWLGRRRGN